MSNDLIRRQDAMNAIEQIDWYHENGKGSLAAGADNEETALVRYSDAETAVNTAPAVNAVEIPCKIGDFVWAIRTFKGVRHPQPGKVSEMYFTQDMRLCIVVSYIARGEWGKTIFPTEEAAAATIETQVVNRNSRW